MIPPGGGSRLQTLGGLAAQLFDSTLRTFSLILRMFEVNIWIYLFLFSNHFNNDTFVYMILPGGGSRLQTLGGLAAQLFDSTLRTIKLTKNYKMSEVSIWIYLFSFPNQIFKIYFNNDTFVYMILPGGGSRLQTLGGLAAQLFDSTLRTICMYRFKSYLFKVYCFTLRRNIELISY